MCTGVEIATLALAAGGTAMGAMAADDAADKQQSIINQAADETAQLDKKKAFTIQDFANKTYNAKDREQRYEDAATKQEGSLVDALLKANEGGKGEVSNATEGALSSDYVRGRGAATAAATDDILKRARLMARSDANSLMYNDEALKGGQLASDLAGINSSISRTNRSANTQLGSVKNNGSLAGGLMAGLAPSAGGYLSGKSAEWDSAMRAMNGG